MKVKAIIKHFFVYILFLAIFILGMLNTTWVYLNLKKREKEVDFIDDFIKATIFDYFVYEIIIITLKSIVFFPIIRTENVSWWKKCLISIIALMPWVSFFYIYSFRSLHYQVNIKFFNLFFK